MKEIEEGLHLVHAEARARKSASEESMEVRCFLVVSYFLYFVYGTSVAFMFCFCSSQVDAENREAAQRLEVFARVDRVDQGSPASKAVKRRSDSPRLV